MILTNFDSLNLHGGRLQGLTSGVINLLHGQPPPEVPMPHHPLLASATLLVAVVTVLMLIGIGRFFVLCCVGVSGRKADPRGRGP